ncbi:MAG TPA: Rieske (2Fe-2S) protein [Planctomycetota bacterium]|nr:Rieske (2Fe-2S) protein [Planctomycetota bacterium]
MSDPTPPPPATPPAADRRGFLHGASSIAMAGGLAAAYGTFGYMAGSFLYPARERARAWVFVTDLARIAVGQSIPFRAPNGERIAIARQGGGGGVEDFVALSSTCPHLGCQVHWEGQNDRFFCPCHNGVFDRDGVGVSGPPGEAGQSLPRYPLKVEGGLLYIEVPIETERIAAIGPRGTGHDDCLQPRPGAGGEPA